jgi:TATA-box binding protein (TBP) (component of TFIID and TFIIIB)
MCSLNDEWENFTLSQNNNIKKQQKPIETPSNIKCTPIYISTKTKIAYLNLKKINLETTFWDIPIIDYHKPLVGILKKSMKFNCCNLLETQNLNTKIDNTNKISVDTISNIITDNKYKDVRKIDIGISKKDLTNFRKKKKGAFYNCFAIIMRIKQDNIFKEVHIKIFNTGKLEIPGIQNDQTLIIALNHLCIVLTNILNTNVSYDEKLINNVLINSNFRCGFFVNRQKLHQLLKFKYNLHSLYDPCSYPGIQCKYYYNKNNKQENGICCCDNKCFNLKKGEFKNNKCNEISFMIFRTGSVLIVGHCSEKILHNVYNFLSKIFINEYSEIHENINEPIKKKKVTNKIRKIKIKVSI